MNFAEIIEILRGQHGDPVPPHVIDPFEMILYENVSYLVDDERRSKAFENLRNVIGLRPEDILNASPEQLRSVAELAGSNKQGQIAKLIRSAEIVREEFDGDLTTVLDRTFVKARAALKRFPSIGEPGAEKILLFNRLSPVLALESNGLRVLIRIGFTEEPGSYSSMYRNAQSAVASQLPQDPHLMIDAYQLLRSHGQTICKRIKPMCGSCAVRPSCSYGSRK